MALKKCICIKTHIIIPNIENMNHHHINKVDNLEHVHINVLCDIKLHQESVDMQLVDTIHKTGSHSCPCTN